MASWCPDDGGGFIRLLLCSSDARGRTFKPRTYHFFFCGCLLLSSVVLVLFFSLVLYFSVRSSGWLMALLIQSRAFEPSF
jgi:hypothetical protein